jgi:hypothetical protein
MEDFNTEYVNDRFDFEVVRRCRPIEEPLEGSKMVCALHGGYWTLSGCLTRQVLELVAAHRQFQFENYGPNRDVVDGTGPEVRWLVPITDIDWDRTGHSPGAREVEGLFREEWDYDTDPDPAKRTWLRMMREEVAEVFAAGSPEALESELVQVAALAVSWIEKIKERRATGIDPNEQAAFAEKLIDLGRFLGEQAESSHKREME